jgi:hypothetical protein
LHKVTIPWKDQGTSTTERAALEKIVRNNIQRMKADELLGKSIESFIKQFITDFKIETPSDAQKQMKLSKQEHELYQKYKGNLIPDDQTIFIDPFIGTQVTYKNLQDWYSKATFTETVTKGKDAKGKDKKSQKKSVTVTNPYTKIRHGIDEYKKNYRLESSMYNLQNEDLKKIRTRFMKLLVFIVNSLRSMYDDLSKIEEKNELKRLYLKVKKSLEDETDPEKIKKLNLLKNSIEAKMTSD